MRKNIAIVAAAGLCLCLASAAFAQAPIGVNGSFGTSGTTIPGDTPPGERGVSGPLWTPEMVPANQPFGDIDTAGAGRTPRSVSAWSQQQTPEKLAELNGRCSVISSPSYSSRYPTDSVQLCSNYAAGVHQD